MIKLGIVNVGERFRDLRTRAGLSKTALAKGQYTVSYVSQIEAGKRTPSPGAMAFFAGRLGVSPRFLATGVPDGMEDALRYRLEEAARATRERRLADAEEGLRSAIDEADRYGLGRLRAKGLAQLGEVLALAERHREAIDRLEEALETGDLMEREAGLAVSRLARTYRTVGDLTYAGVVVEDFLKRPDRPPLEPGILAELQSVLVSVYFERGDIHLSEEAALRALASAGQGAPPEIRANAYWDASRVMAEVKRWDEALEFATRARVLMEELDDRRSVARLHNAYAFICLEADPPKIGEAARHLDLAEAMLEEVGGAIDISYVQSERARLALLEGRPSDALRDAERALILGADDENDRPKTLFLVGRANAELGRRPEARGALVEAAALFEKQGAKQHVASCYRELGELDLAAGDTEAAMEAFRTGLAALDPKRMSP
jgi:tetratricopeptide (TPR) repeat protein